VLEGRIYHKSRKLARCWWLTPIILTYSGGRDQEDHDSKPAQINSFARPYLKKPFTKIGWLTMKTLCSSLSTAKKKSRKLRTSRSGT
jgi:hypothetical protein